MMGSTLLGMVLGVVVAAYLTIHYADAWNDWVVSLRAVDQPAAVEKAGSAPPGIAESAAAPESITTPVSAGELIPAPAASPLPGAHAQEGATKDSGTPQPGDELEQRWAAFAARADQLQPVGDFRWRECFTRASAAHGVSEPLLLAIASGESDFDSAARSDKDAIGLMQIRWPDTSRHLGVLREADLYDPCTNVAAGARYLAELSSRFDRNLHRVVAAYNYGPGRIDAGVMPEGARWYSQYIYQHLQRVLGNPHVPTSELIAPRADRDGGFEVLFRFNQPYRARDFVSFLETQVPDLELAHRSEALGQHEVVLLYQGESERLRAMDSLRDAGLVIPGQPIGNPKTF